MTDNELDALFKQAAEERPVSFDARAWTKMQAKLRTARYIRWVKRGAGSLIVLGLILGYWMLNSNSKLQNSNSDSNSNTKNSQIIDNQKIVNSDSNSKLRNTDSDSKLNAKNSQMIDNQKVANSDSKLQISDSKLQNSNSDNKLKENNPQVLDNQRIINSDSKRSSQNPQVLDNQDVTNSNSDNKLKENKVIHNFVGMSRDLRIPSVGFKKPTPLFPWIGHHSPTVPVKVTKTENNSQVSDNQLVTLASKEIAPTQVPVSKGLNDSLRIEQNQSSKRFGRWAIQLSVAPDWSMVGKAKSFKIGENFGLSAEYQVFKNLSVTMGANYTNKVYLADPDQYKPYPGIWQVFPKPEEIDASCKVLEIPMNVRFYALNLPKNRFFVGSGISSYWMLHERYQYNYADPYYPYRVKELNNENRHLWSILNFSLGWEKSLSSHWRIQIEPYLKMPLGDVGFGKVRLVSTGAFLNLKYQFLR